MKKNIYIDILDNENKLVRGMQLNEVPLYEDYVLATSKREYSNDEPCVVIRTCIRNNVYKAFTKYLKGIDRKLEGHLYVGDLPKEYTQSIDFGDRATTIIFRHENIVNV